MKEIIPINIGHFLHKYNGMQPTNRSRSGIISRKYWGYLCFLVEKAKIMTTIAYHNYGHYSAIIEKGK
jgi:hypothetical protein